MKALLDRIVSTELSLSNLFISFTRNGSFKLSGGLTVEAGTGHRIFL